MKNQISNTVARWKEIQQNSELRQNLLRRQEVIAGIREFFTQSDFHEVETPLLVAHPGTEPYLDLFQTEIELASGTTYPGYLLTSPEYAMKKLLSAGLPRIFQICKSFRNGEGLGDHHNHEFTILEWYRTEADYQDIMSDCENLVKYLAQKTQGSATVLQYQNQHFNLENNWPRLRVFDLFNETFGCTTEEFFDSDYLRELCQQNTIQIDSGQTWDDYFVLLFDVMILPKIQANQQPVFITDFPASQAALSKKSAQDPRFAERFELYIGGIEIGNAFTELNDPVEQRARIQEELALRAELGKSPLQPDEDFLNALAEMPDAGGIAVGVDRLVMLMLDVPSIHDCTWFSTRDVFAFD